MSGTRSSAIRVLHVDDDLDFVETSAECVEREAEAIEVDTATDAAAALDRLDAEDDVDCVVSEYDLPGRDGIELLEAVREEHPELPFVLFTAEGSERVASEAISAGATDYLRKRPQTDQSALLADRIRDAVDAARAERARRRHIQAIDTAQEGFSIIDESGEFAYVNEAYADLYGYEPEEMIGERFELTYPPGELEVVQGDAFEAIEEAGYWHGETTGLRADGTTFVEDHKLVRTETGDLICNVRDKSERTGNRRAIEGLHSTVRALMEAKTPEAATDIAVTSVRDVVGLGTGVVYRASADRLEPVAWTDRAEEVLGEVRALTGDDGVAWTVHETGERELLDAEAAGSTPPFADSAIRSAVLLPLDEYGLLAVGSEDENDFRETNLALVQTLAAHAATALKGIRSEQELREEREFVDQAIETLNDVFYVLGPDGSLRRWNDRLRRVSGYPDEEIREMRFQEFFAEGDRDRVSAALEEIDATGQATFEAELSTADGERIPYEFAGARLTDVGEDDGIVGIGRDVSVRKAQERKLERQNDRLDEFAGIISHDLRNPLNVAEGRLELAQEECDSEHLEAVAGAHERMETLIDDILAVAREGETALEEVTVDLAHVAAESWAHVDTEDATLAAETTRTVLADRTQLQQLFENCFRNAVEHGGPAVTVTVGDLADGFYVADDGEGIPEDERDRVFEPGYTTLGGGTGLGLNIVGGIAESHGWDVSIVESADGGARLEFTDVESEG